MNGDDEYIEADVLRKLTIPRMRLPTTWRGAVTEEELKKFDEKTRPVLFYLSKVENKLDFVIEWSEITNRHQRELEAKFIRQSSFKINLAKWAIATIGSAVLVVVGTAIGNRLLGR